MKVHWEQKFVWQIDMSHIIKMAAMPYMVYMVFTLNIFSGTKEAIDLGLNMQHWGHGPNKIKKNNNNKKQKYTQKKKKKKKKKKTTKNVALTWTILRTGHFFAETPIDKSLNIFLSVTRICGMLLHLIYLYEDFFFNSNYCPGIKK